MNLAKKAPHGAPPYTLPVLPYPATALAPAISEATLLEHHDGHHRKYIDETNKLVAGSPFEGLLLADLVKATAGKADHTKLFNNAAQAWNHAFYWRSLTAKPNAPSGELGRLVSKSFESLDALKQKLEAEATAHFGSGWAWLVMKGGTLSIETTHDAKTPLTEKGVVPLLTVDVWEHAYYLDRKRDRAAYLKAVSGRLLNWDFAAEALEAGSGGKTLDLGTG